MRKDVDRIDREDLTTLFPTLPDRANKGMMGRVLCVCGSYDPHGVGMCGAAYFAAMAAYRCGAGIVEIFTPEENYPSLAAIVPEAVFSLYTCDDGADAVIDRLKRAVALADAVVIGCGLGRSELALGMVGAVLRHSEVPTVIDADALNIIAEHGELMDEWSAEKRSRAVITPHPGEMSRLTGKTVSEILADTVNTASEFSARTGVVCVLKDHKTVITDGHTVYVNDSGNAGMASAGMGDVLSGVLGALLARDTVSESADMSRIGENQTLLRSATGVYLHGCAGDVAAQNVGQYSLVASDVLEALCEVIPSK